MPIRAKSFLPHLVEQIFKKYGPDFEDFEVRTKSNVQRVASCTQFFVELEVVFGEELLKSAIRLLDTHTITIYYTETQLREIAEISAGSANVVKLYPGVNFCPCDFFSHHVLLSAPIITGTDIRYTCKHVLGLRLAKLLQSPCLRTEILPKHRFNFMLNQMLST